MLHNSIVLCIFSAFKPCLSPFRPEDIRGCVVQDYQVMDNLPTDYKPSCSLHASTTIFAAVLYVRVCVSIGPSISGAFMQVSEYLPCLSHMRATTEVPLYIVHEYHSDGE